MLLFILQEVTLYHRLGILNTDDEEVIYCALGPVECRRRTWSATKSATFSYFVFNVSEQKFSNVILANEYFDVNL